MGDKYMFHSFISLQQFDKSRTDGMNTSLLTKSSYSGQVILMFVATGPNRGFINKLTLLSQHISPMLGARV